jgi:hypothetical protein
MHMHMHTYVDHIPINWSIYCSVHLVLLVQENKCHTCEKIFLSFFLFDSQAAQCQTGNIYHIMTLHIEKVIYIGRQKQITHDYLQKTNRSIEKIFR